MANISCGYKLLNEPSINFVVTYTNSPLAFTLYFLLYFGLILYCL